MDSLKACFGDVVFEQPWHAQLFALTVQLHLQGCFGWADWGQILGATIRSHGLSETINGGDDYFTAWLVAFEQMLGQLDIASPAQIENLRMAWAEAYVATPHGQLVKLT